MEVTPGNLENIRYFPFVCTIENEYVVNGEDVFATEQCLQILFVLIFYKMLTENLTSLLAQIPSFFLRKVYKRKLLRNLD